MADARRPPPAIAILRASVLAWLRDGLANPAGMLRISDDRQGPWITDAELGQALLLGLVQRYRPLDLRGFEGFALTGFGRWYLAWLAAAETPPRACLENPFEAALREREAATREGGA